MFLARGVQFVHSDPTGLFEAPHLRLRMATLLPDPGERGVDLLDRGVGLGDRRHRLREPGSPFGVLGLGAREFGTNRLERPTYSLAFGYCRVDRGLDLEAGPSRRRAAHRPARSRELSVAGHRTHTPIRLHLGQGRAQVIHHHHVDQQRGHRCREIRRDIHDVQCPAGPVEQVHLQPVVTSRFVPPHQPGPAGVRLTQCRQHLEAIHPPVDHHRVDGRAEGDAHRALPAVPHAEHLPHCSGHGVAAEVAYHPFGPVTGALVLLERLDAGREPGDLLVRLTFDRLQLCETCPGRQVCPLRPSEVVVQAALALTVDTDPCMDGVELCLRVDHRVASGHHLGVHARDLGLRGLHARGQGVDLPGEPRDALPPVGDRPHRLEMLGLERGERRLRAGE